MKTKIKQSVMLGLVLSACATLAPSTASAVDAVGGNATNNNIIVPGVGWTILRAVTFQNPTQRYCIATGSADAENPTTFATAVPFQYAFTVSDSATPLPDQGQERTLEFWNQFNVQDNRIKEITTTGGWMGNVLANPGYFTMPAIAAPFQGRTIYFLARKLAAAAPNLRVLDNSLTVTCTDNKLVPPIPLIPL